MAEWSVVIPDSLCDGRWLSIQASYHDGLSRVWINNIPVETWINYFKWLVARHSGAAPTTGTSIPTEGT